MRFTLTLIIALFIVSSLVPAQTEPVGDWENRVRLPPLLMTQRRGEDTRGSVLWPFIHWRTEGPEVEWGFRPLINWERNFQENSISVDLLWPLINWNRSGEDLDWRVFPVYGGWRLNRQWVDPERYFIIFPLVSIKREPHRSSTWIGLFARMVEEEHHGTMRFTALFPFWRSVDERSDETSTSIFPVIWGTRGDETSYFVLFPFWWDIDFQTGGHFRGLMPLWGRHREVANDGSMRAQTDLLLPPLYVNAIRDGGERNNHYILWPLIAWGNGPNESLVRVLPFFSRQVAPVAGENAHREDLYIFPALIASYYEGEQAFGRRITTPLFWRWWGPDLADRQRTTWGTYPLFNVYSTEGVDSGFSIFDPLFFLEGRETHDRLAMLWRFFHHEHTADGVHSDTELLWRLFKCVREGDSTHTSVFPFITVDRSPEAHRTAFLWRLFEYSGDTEGSYLRLFFSPRFRIGGGTSPSSESEG